MPPQNMQRTAAESSSYDPTHRSLPCAMMALRSASRSASSMKCVWTISHFVLRETREKRTCLEKRGPRTDRTMSLSRRASFRQPHTSLLAPGSNPVVGSSRITTVGSPIMASATLKRRFARRLMYLPSTQHRVLVRNQLVPVY